MHDQRVEQMTSMARNSAKDEERNKDEADNVMYIRKCL